MGALSFRRALAGMPAVAATCLALASGASCGSRTGLLEGPAVPVDASDVIPTIDAFHPDVPVRDRCPDAAATLIYAIGRSGTLYSYDPSAGAFDVIGALACPGSEGTPFSMAVDRQGVAYVVFSASEGDTTFATGLFRVSTKTGVCAPTTYDPRAHGSLTFGMGFVAEGAGEKLFLSLDLGPTGFHSDGELATLDTTTFEETEIAKFEPTVQGAELTGTGDGRLFAFSPSTDPSATFIAQIDPTTAEVIAEDPLPGIVQGQGWAFGFWGGAFYTFTTPGPQVTTTEVHRFDPVTKAITPIGVVNDTIVGAGVSTCAPQS